MNCYNIKISKKEWDMLAAINDDILSKGCDDMRGLLKSLTEEEVAVMLKWVRRYTDKHFPDGDYTSIVGKSIVVEEYIYANAMDAVINNLDTVAKYIKLWKFAIDNS